MDRDRFWEIIDRSVAQSDGDSDAQIDLISGELREMEPDEIVGFNQQMDQCRTEANSWNLWAASYLVNGDDSDDAFDNFQAWLIGHGREAFESSVANPDALVDYIDPEEDGYEMEELLDLPRQIFEEMTEEGEEYDTGIELTASRTGERWDFDSETEYASRMPQLWQRVEVNYQATSENVELAS